MAKHNSDYIPTYADIEKERDTRMERIAKNVRPIHTYTAMYKINGTSLTETVNGSNASEVEEVIRHNCKMVGWNPTGLTITLVAE